MATAVAIAPPKSRYDTVAELVRELGGVPLSRILLTALPGTATEADQLRMCESGDRLVELIDGTLVEKAMGAREGFMAITLNTYLMIFVRKHNLGIVGGADIIHRIIDGQNRLPDVSFTAWATLPDDDAHLQPISDYTPDLCIEILSESNTRKEMDRSAKSTSAAVRSWFGRSNPRSAPSPSTRVRRGARHSERLTPSTAEKCCRASR